MPSPDSTARFSSRVENYIRYRPSYPKEVIDSLERECGLSRDSVVADIASGTGIFSKLLLEHGNRVFGVEPNREMRRAGEEFLRAYPNFISLSGTAEATTLPGKSADFITAAQAAHWFNPKKAREEFVRILQSGGWLVLLWNERKIDSTPFLRDYEQLLLNYGTDYQEVRHEHTVVSAYYVPLPYHEKTFELGQEFDYAGVEGRLLSSSYTPGPDDPKYQPMLRELRVIFDRHQQSGKIAFEYITRMYYGRLA